MFVCRESVHQRLRWTERASNASRNLWNSLMSLEKRFYINNKADNRPNVFTASPRSNFAPPQVPLECDCRFVNISVNTPTFEKFDNRRRNHFALKCKKMIGGCTWCRRMKPVRSVRFGKSIMEFMLSRNWSETSSNDNEGNLHRDSLLESTCSIKWPKFVYVFSVLYCAIWIGGYRLSLD